MNTALRRIKPTKPYNGLTVVLSQPSRGDLELKYLISGHAGVIFNEALQKQQTSRWACDIRTVEELNENKELLSETKGILLLGEPALHALCPTLKDYKLTEVRGTPIQSIYPRPTLCSFTPQDACDLQNYEKRLNPLLLESLEEDEKESDNEAKSRHGATQRKNYLFWLGADVRKILHKINGGEIYDSSKYVVRIYPRYDEIIAALDSLTGGDIYFDIETDSERNITVIGFSLSNSYTIYSFPILDYNYQLYYGSNTYRIVKALIRCLSRNRIIIHNCMFDLFILLWKYRLLIFDNIYDTMLAQKRIFTEVEKSLGHTLSYYPEIWEPYHKDEGIFEPKNSQQERQLIEYNAKDIIALRLIYAAQCKHSRDDAGLIESIQQANEAPYAFLISTLTGILVDEMGIAEQLSKNDQMLNQLMRISKILVGPMIDVLPSSPKSCINYFHHALGYTTVSKTDKGQPKLDATNLLKLKLKYPLNAMIDVCLKYREIKTMSGHLKAQPLKGWHE